VENLSSLRNLEYLSITNGSVNHETFIGLNKLISLKLNRCGVFCCRDFDILSNLCNLEILEINKLSFPVNLDGLENLAVLYLSDIKNFDYIKNLSDNLRGLKLRFSGVESNTMEFFKRYSFPNLTHLLLVNGFNPDWLNSLSNLIKLQIRIRRICNINIKGDLFSKLKNLRYLDISRNRFYFEPNVFLGLDNLETLVIKRSLLNHKKVALQKGVFNGLSSLKSLDLTSNNIEFIDQEVFIHTPNLTHLKIGGINCKLDEKTFCHLKNLKTIEMSKSDLNHIDSNVLETFKRSNIKILIYK
jgi:hypothetical protein